MNTKHNNSCTMAFGRPSKHVTCPRCEELKQGATPRTWAISRRKLDEARTLQAIREHDCKKSNCGPVCTAFDW